MGIPTIFDYQFARQRLNQIDCNDSDGLIEKKNVKQEDKNIVRELIASLERTAKFRTNSIEPDEKEKVTEQNSGRKGISNIRVDVSSQQQQTSQQKQASQHKQEKNSEREISK